MWVHTCVGSGVYAGASFAVGALGEAVRVSMIDSMGVASACWTVVTLWMTILRECLGVTHLDGLNGGARDGV